MAKPFTLARNFGRGLSRLDKDLRDWFVILNDLFDDSSGHDHNADAEGGPIAAGALGTDAIPDSAAIVKIFSVDAFDSAALVDVFADNSFNEATVDALFDAGAIDGDRLKAAGVADDRLVSFLVKEPGHVAVGRADFAATADGAITVTIGVVVFLEADAEDLPNGVWTNGGSGNDSAVSLAAAINGDTRNGGIYAAVVLTDTVFIFNRLVGTAGNVAIVVSANEPASVENLVGGTAEVVKRQAHIMHTVTALEVAVVGGAPQVLIPLPFDASFFSWQVYDSTGGIYATELTARGTVTNASGSVPAFFKLAENGAVDVQAGDIIRLIVQE